MLKLAEELCIDPLRRAQLRLPYEVGLNIVYSAAEDINCSRVIADCGTDPGSNVRARFIRTACNAHAELVNNLRRLLAAERQALTTAERAMLLSEAQGTLDMLDREARRG